MTRLIADISTSLDGFVAGPNPSLEQPLGEGGERLHDWVIATASWRALHGLDGGAVNEDDAIVKETNERVGAYVMGRRMFSGGSGPWEDDPNADAWFGDNPPFKAPVFVLTHHPRATVTKQGGTSYVFVTDGIEAAVERARAAADGKDVQVAGGAEAIQQALRAGLLDELQIHVAPVLLGGGTRLLDNLEGTNATLELDRVEASAAVAHVRYRISY